MYKDNILIYNIYIATYIETVYGLYFVSKRRLLRCGYVFVFVEVCLAIKSVFSVLLDYAK